MNTDQIEQSIEVHAGPSGRAMAQEMESDLVEGFQQHLNLERLACSFYLSMACWSSEHELKGFCTFFTEESRAEQQHSSQFADYMIARGQKVDLHQLDSPRQSWSSIEEIIAASFQLEADLTSSILQIYSLAEQYNDLRSTVFLDENIENQIKSENEFAYLLGRVKFCQNQPSALLLIDNELTNKQHSPGSLI